MAGKRPWCAEGVCTPSVPMHVKDCGRRKVFLNGQALESDQLVQELLAYQKERLADARRDPGGAARAAVPILMQEIEDPAQREAEHWVRGRAKCAEGKCCGAMKYHRPGCERRAASLAKRREGEKPVLTAYPATIPQPRKPWWKRVFGG